MFRFFILLITIILIGLVYINNREGFVGKLTGSGLILVDLNTHKDITIKAEECSISDNFDTKEICIDNACLSKDDLIRLDKLHIKIKDSICIDQECIKKKKLRYLKQLWPPGTITIYNGDLGMLPDGWQICDGENGTPDLRDKFILGSDIDYRKQYKTIGSGLCGNKFGLINRFIQDNGKLSSNNCEEHCNDLMHCTGYNVKKDGTCLLWYDDISDKKLFTVAPSDGMCRKKTITGGSNKHHLTIDEIPEHYHVLPSNNPGSGDGNEKLGIKAAISTKDNVGDIHKHKNTFSNKLSDTGKNKGHENLPPYDSLYYVMKTDPKYKDPSLSLVNKLEELEKQWASVKETIV